jgi:hypothetical protein
MTGERLERVVKWKVEGNAPRIWSWRRVASAIWHMSLTLCAAWAERKTMLRMEISTMRLIALGSGDGDDPRKSCAEVKKSVQGMRIPKVGIANRSMEGGNATLKEVKRFICG